MSSRPANLLSAISCAALLLLAGCGVGTSPSPFKAGLQLQGAVHGGQQPISGSTIQLYAVGTGGDGSAATPLVGNTVLTDVQGTFNLTAGTDYTCPTASTLVYLTATGGNPGLSAGSNNPQVALMLALGQCGPLSAATNVVINEVTTVAATYALSPYISSLTSIGSGSNDATAFAAAFTLAGQYSDMTTGLAPGPNVPTGFTVPVAQIYTVADIVATCINSTGGLSGSSTICGSLLALTTPANASAPTDTIAALINLATHPALNTPSLYGMATPSAPFQPKDVVQPADLSIALIPLSTMTVSPSSLSITASGQAAPVAVNVTNNGPGPITLNSVSFAGTNAADFSQTNNCPVPLPGSTTCTVFVLFTPATAGSRTATMTIVTSASNSSATIGLTGYAAVPKMQTVSSVSFPSTAVGAASPLQTLAVSNIGGSPLILFNPLYSDPTDFTESDNCQGGVAPGTSCTVSVRFNPARAGQRLVTLSFHDNEPGTKSSAISLTGTATASPSVGPLVASTQSLFVATGATGIVDLTNRGSSAIAIASITADTYTQTNGCGTSLAAGDSCAIFLTPMPTSYSYTVGTLTIANSSPVPSLTVTMLSSTASPVGGSIPAIVGTTVSGPQIIVPPFSNLTFSGLDAPDFSGSGCSSRSSCSVIPNYTPSALGSRIALTNLQNQGLMLYTVFGVAAGALQTVTSTPSSLDFAQTALGGTSSSQTVTVSNPQSHIINLITQTADFTVAPAFCKTSTCVVTVTFTPKTAVANKSQGTLRLFDSGTNVTTSVYLTGYAGIPTLQFSPSQLAFGAAVVGSITAAQTISISAQGDSPAYLGINFPVGPTQSQAGSDFLGVSTSAVVSSGTPYLTSGYKFAPTALGSRNATVKILDNRSGLLLATYTLTGTGVGTLTTTLGASPTSLAFPSTVIGTSSTALAVTVTNSGNTVATFGAISFNGINPADFSRTTNCAATLAAGASCAVNVTFNPAATGTRSASLIIPSNDPSSPLTVSLAGTGLRVPLVTISPTSLTFYERGVPQAVTLTNTMATALNISAFNMTTTGGGAAEFAQTNNCGTVLAANSSCTISVSAGPDPGGFTGSMSVVDDDTIDAQMVTLSSNVPTSTLVDFGSTGVGFQSATPGSISGGVYNGSTTDLSVTAFGPNAADFMGSGGGSPYCTVSLNSPCAANVFFTPSAVGVRYDLVTTNDGAKFLLKGIGYTPVYSFTITPSGSLDFGAVAFGASSGQQSVFVHNTSVPFQAVENISVSLSTGPGNNGDFSFTTNCSVLSYQGASSCNIYVTFHPTVVGARTTTLTVDDGKGLQQTVTYTGTGK